MSRLDFDAGVSFDVDGMAVRLIGSSAVSARALASVGARVGATGMAVVGEGALTPDVVQAVAACVASGENVVVLAQKGSASCDGPLLLAFRSARAGSGVPGIRRTIGSGALPSLPRRGVVVTADSGWQLDAVVGAVGTAAGPDTPVVVVDDTDAGSAAGAVVASHGFGEGRIVFCQYGVCGEAARGEPSARALLGDVLRWAAVARPILRAEEVRMPDGRRAARYHHRHEVAR